MPFTPSHVAAILPLAGRRDRGLPLAALAAGSMSPDLPYFQPVADWRLISPPIIFRRITGNNKMPLPGSRMGEASPGFYSMSRRIGFYATTGGVG